MRRHPASESRREDGPGTESTKRCGKEHAVASRHFRSFPFVPVRPFPGQCMLCDSGSRDARQDWRAASPAKDCTVWDTYF